MEPLMNAAILYAPADLRVEKTPRPSAPAATDVVIRVKSAGVCGSDLDRVMVTGTYHFPTIPGHEFCGVIEETGPAVTRYRKGDRVLVAPMLPCYQCDSCRQGNYGQCDSYSFLGSRTNGAFAEFVTAPQSNLLPLPGEVTFEQGAIVEPAAVTLHGLYHLEIKGGEDIVVLGCGAIGLLAVQLVKTLGATRVIACDIDNQKLALARQSGADICINSLEQSVIEAVKGQTDGKGADIIIETAGVSFTQVQSIALCKKHGQVLYLGTAHADVVLKPAVFELIMRNEITLTGSWNAYSAPFPGREWRTVLQYLADGRLKVEPLISHKVTLGKLPETIAGMAAKAFPYVKVVVTPEEI